MIFDVINVCNYLLLCCTSLTVISSLLCCEFVFYDASCCNNYVIVRSFAYYSFFTCMMYDYALFMYETKDNAVMLMLLPAALPAVQSAGI